MRLLGFWLFFGGAFASLEAQVFSFVPAEQLLPLGFEQKHKNEFQTEFGSLRYISLYALSAEEEGASLKEEEAKWKEKTAPALSSILQQEARPEALFCKWELKMDKAAKINCRFRLGSVDYVDYLEGKRESY